LSFGHSLPFLFGFGCLIPNSGTHRGFSSSKQSSMHPQRREAYRDEQSHISIPSLVSKLDRGHISLLRIKNSNPAIFLIISKDQSCSNTQRVCAPTKAREEIRNLSTIIECSHDVWLDEAAPGHISKHLTSFLTFAAHDQLQLEAATQEPAYTRGKPGHRRCGAKHAATFDSKSNSMAPKVPATRRARIYLNLRGKST